MKGKLVKNKHFYALQIDSNIIAVSLDRETEEHTVNYKHSLSKQNCQEIANGYDLNELADKYYMKFENQIGNPALFYRYFKLIFPKALELVEHRLSKETEWQVEVIMDKIPADLAPGGWDVFPKLDADNCLILKRVE